MDETVKKSLLILILICPAISKASYVSAELFTVQWGESNDQLEASPFSRIDPGTPEDSSDDYSDPGGGPNLAFVDKDENVIFSSYSECQLKGYSNSGELMFDLSCEADSNAPPVYRGTPDNLYIDSLSQIYLTTYTPSNYLPVLDYKGNLIDSLKPFPNYPDSAIDAMNWSPKGSLFLYSSGLGWVTYSQGIFTPGGSWCFWAVDTTIRSVREVDSSSIRFYKFQNPDIYGNPATRDSTIIHLSTNGLIYANLLNGGDGTRLYVLLDFLNNEIFSHELRVFDLNLDSLDTIILNSEPAYYDNFPRPFITANGDIYEFRAWDDGLHVIKWTKQ